MAITKNAWLEVKNSVSTADTIIHEDQDISLWIAGKNMKIIQANDVLVTSPNQSFRYLPKLLKYSKMRAVTKKFHRKAGNLPAPFEVRLNLLKRAFSLILATPFLILGVLSTMLMLPVDFFEVKLRHNRSWFD